MAERDESFACASEQKKKYIDMEYAAELLFDLHLPVKRVASMVGVTHKTLYKRFEEEGIDIRGHRFTEIRDEDLEKELKNIIQQHPNAGEVYVTGHLRSRGINVQRRRIREAMHLVDPEGCVQRLTHTVSRRTYSVPCPNFLWHIDGAHKLVMWKFVVHAAIDGFSRIVVYLLCSNSNKSSVVTSLFSRAVRQYGWPIRVRTDYGGENVGVWDEMIRHRGHRSVIAGSSVHNNRVERLHRDVNTQVVRTYKTMFLQMEQDGILDRENETDLFCLHYVFMPRINKTLAEFRSAHNNHSISTEGNHTPIQLFHINQHLIPQYENGMESSDAVTINTGISVEELQRCDLPHVRVEPIECPLTFQDFRALRRTIDPLSGENPVSVYKQVCEFVLQHLTQ